MNIQQGLYSIYDVKAEVYFPPFVAGRVGEALRIFEDLLSDPQSRLSRHPNDYRLFAIGAFSVDTGMVADLHGGVKLIEEGLTLVKEA